MAFKRKAIMIPSFFKNIRTCILITSTTLLISCASPITSIQLQPTLLAPDQGTQLANKEAWDIMSQDYRVEQYLIEVINGRKAATLINESKSSRLIIEDTLKNQWQKEGLNFALNSPNQITIKIVKLLASVKQTTVSYSTDSNVIINVQLKTQDKLFNKVFKSNFRKEGPFGVDIDATAKQLNTQLSELLNQIINDPELNNKLQQR